MMFIFHIYYSFESGVIVGVNRFTLIFFNSDKINMKKTHITIIRSPWKKLSVPLWDTEM